MSIKPIDLEGMFKEIEMIRKKYGIPKGVLFVPNKLEIVLERKEIDKFDLTYTEFFNYLPDHVLKIAKENSIQLLQQMGLPLKKIIQMNNGVKVEMSGDFRIAVWPIIEILFQNKDNKTVIKTIFESINKIYQTLTQNAGFHWDWNNETESKYNNFLTTLIKIMQEHPSISDEMEAVISKYTSEKP